MIVESLKINLDLINNRGLNRVISLCLISSSLKLKNSIIVENIFQVHSIKNLKTDVICEGDQKTNPSLKTLNQKLQYLREIKSNFHYYLLVIHSVHLDAKAKEVGIKAFSPNRIVNDILNLLALYYYNYFILEEENYPRIDQKLLEKMILNNTQNPSESQELSRNINNICQLRIEQFYLLQRGLSLFNHALHSIETNISIAFCFLISSIETYAEKYGDISEKWEDYKHINFYNILKKILEKIENKKLYNELFQEIGERYIKDSHRVLAKLKKFILDFINPSFRLLEDINDNHLKILISDYYSLRSKYMHSGKELPISDMNKSIIYNITDKGKIKTYDEGSKYEVKVLLPLSYLITIIRGCIINFIRHLFNNRELESDKKKYKDPDRQPRGTLRITAKKKLLPGMAVSGKNIQRKEQYFDLYIRTQEIAKLDQHQND